MRAPLLHRGCDILGVEGPAVNPTGMVPLLRMHLEYGIPLSLHLSGTFIETLAWHCPEALRLLRRLLGVGLFELVGSTFGQNIMPFFSEEETIRQINDQLWLCRHHLGCDPKDIRTFWVPEPRAIDQPLAAATRKGSTEPTWSVRASKAPGSLATDSRMVREFFNRNIPRLSVEGKTRRPSAISPRATSRCRRKPRRGSALASLINQVASAAPTRKACGLELGRCRLVRSEFRQ